MAWVVSFGNRPTRGIQYTMNMRYGLCCKLSDGGSHKTMTRKQYLKLRSECGLATTMFKISQIAIRNFNVTSDLGEICDLNKWVYRVGSNMVPVVTIDGLDFGMDDIVRVSGNALDVAAGRLKKLVSEGLRISCHPDQFNVLASENGAVCIRTQYQLEHEARIMTMFGAESNYNSPMNIHMNCSRGTHAEIADRFVRNWNRLSPVVRSRLVLENEDKGIWTVEALYKYIHQRTGIPITFDYLHHQCNPGTMSERDAFECAYSTWPDGVRPLFHYAQSDPGNKNKRAHASMPYGTPFDTYGKSFDVDMEFKNKDLAIVEYCTKILTP
jgi:UV DNA damage endonuclease